MARLQHLAQFLGQLIQGQSHAVLAKCRQDRPGQAVVGDFDSSRVDAILRLVQEGDSLPHDCGGVGSASLLSAVRCGAMVQEEVEGASPVSTFL